MVGRILVVGGGIAGLSAAIALNDAGLTVELVEARPQWPVTGAAITMHANGVRALGNWGSALGCGLRLRSCRRGASTMLTATCSARLI
ncbi:MAG: FAD-dependent oxidoreductase [Propionibacteriaceae bacterium]